MSILGLYFGPKVITLAEIEGRKVVKDIRIPMHRLSTEGVEDKVPDDIKISTSLKDEIKRSGIAGTEVSLVISGRDLITRTFHMPVLPPAEIYNAVRFEAKKYIPFKVEELVSDFQVQMDKTARKNFVLFVGVKKDILDKYVSISSQTGLKPVSIEYSGFSASRLLKLGRIQEKGVVALVTVDLAEEDEVNFLVLEDGFPLFSRDIILTQEQAAAGAKSSVDLAQSLEKLKVELRISLDFYLRKFPTTNIKNVVFFAPEELRSELGTFIRERGLTAQFLETRTLLDRPMPYSGSFLKAYAGGIGKAVRSDIKIDLLPSKTKARGAQIAGAGAGLFGGMQINPAAVIVGLVCIAAPFVWHFYQQAPIKNELGQLLGSRPQVPGVNPELSYEELVSKNNKFQESLKAAIQVLNNRPFLTEALDSIPRSLPKGVWLRDIVYSQDEKAVTITLQGYAFNPEDSSQEISMINKFSADLAQNQLFNKVFKAISSASIEQTQIEQTKVTSFSIVCRSK